LNDPNLIFKDEKGNIQTREWVNELFKKEKVSISQKKNADGKTEMTFYILSEKENEENEKRVSDGIEKLKTTKFPDFNLSTVDEKKISNKDLEGKVVVFNFWFTSCVPCLKEMPELNKIAEKYKDNKSVIFLAPSFEESKLIKKFLLH
jgi:thiol-disulfide isomerase/thioredoxin